MAHIHMEGKWTSEGAQCIFRDSSGVRPDEFVAVVLQGSTTVVVRGEFGDSPLAEWPANGPAREFWRARARRAVTPAEAIARLRGFVG